MFVQQSFIKGTQRWTQTQSCLTPGGAERVRCGAVLYPWQVKPSPRCKSRGGGSGTVRLPSSTMLLWAEEAWGARLRQQAVRRRRVARADGMSPPPLKPHTDGGNLLLLLKGDMWAKAGKTASRISEMVPAHAVPCLSGNLLKIRSKRYEFTDGKPELFLHGAC